MTVLDRFLSFTRGLSSDRREAVEESLAALMESFADRYDFSPAELVELDRRVAEPHPEFSDPRDIEELFGKRFGA